jgi:hypothetical protein
MIIDPGSFRKRGWTAGPHNPHKSGAALLGRMVIGHGIPDEQAGFRQKPVPFANIADNLLLCFRRPMDLLKTGAKPT